MSKSVLSFPLCGESGIFVCLEFLILSFTWNFFAYFKYHSDWGRVIGKIKQKELDCRDTAPFIIILIIIRKKNSKHYLR